MITCISIHLDDNEKIGANAAPGIYRPSICIKATAPDGRERDVTIHGDFKQLALIAKQLSESLDGLPNKGIANDASRQTGR